MVKIYLKNKCLEATIRVTFTHHILRIQLGSMNTALYFLRGKLMITRARAAINHWNMFIRGLVGTCWLMTDLTDKRVADIQDLSDEYHSTRAQGSFHTKYGICKNEHKRKSLIHKKAQGRSFKESKVVNGTL